MPLTNKQLDDICLINRHNFDGPLSAKACRYCCVDDLDSTKFYCAKKTSKKASIDTEVKEQLEKWKKSGADPKIQGCALGDNCPGYPVLKYVDQGYDV